MELTVLGASAPANNMTGIKSQWPAGFVLDWHDGKSPRKLLIECSEGIRFRMEQAGFDYAEIEDILISHIHPDHFGGFIPFVQALFTRGLWEPNPQKNKLLREKILQVYCPGEIMLNYYKLWALQNPDVAEGFPFPKFNWHNMSVTANRQIALSPSCFLSALDTYHGFGKVKSLCFRLKTPAGVFAYSGDSGECEGIRQICQRADLFVCEAAARAGDENNPTGYGHLNPRLAGEIAQAGSVKKLVLFHYTGLDSNEAITASCREGGFTGDIIIAQDGMQIQF